MCICMCNFESSIPVSLQYGEMEKVQRKLAIWGGEK